MIEDNNRNLSFKEAKRTREELYLTTLHYIAVDPRNDTSWINVIGATAFTAWLQMQTLVDRSENALPKYGNLSTIPRSINDLAKTLRMSRTTLYNKVLKVLWDYGFIDFEEWDEQKKAGQKATNVLIYPYPQNNIELQHKPLVKVRDYNTEYTSNAKTYNNVEIKKQRANHKSEFTLNNSNYEVKWAHDIIIEKLREIHIKESILKEIQYELSFFPSMVIPIKVMEDQLFHMERKIRGKDEIFNFAKYFVGGVINRTEMLDSMTGVKAAAEVMERQDKVINVNSNMFYNWLEIRE